MGVTKSNRALGHAGFAMMAQRMGGGFVGDSLL
jgi:hypothetical protein